MESTTRGSKQVELSVVIATYNRCEQLRASLRALARQTLPAECFEVIVVIDGSTDGTSSMLTSLSVPFTLRAIEQANRGQVAALNRGVNEAYAPYCLFLDDDIIAEPGLLEAHLRAQQESGGVMGLGRLNFSLNKRADWFAKLLAEWWREHYERLGQGRVPVAIRDCFMANLSVPRDAFLQAGGLLEGLPRGHDVDLGYRLSKGGLPVVYIEGARAGQVYDKRFREIAADLRKEGAGEIGLYGRYPEVLPQLRVSSFNSAPRRAVLLRRAFLLANVPDIVLFLLGGILAAMRRRYLLRLWYELVSAVFFWQGVRTATGSDTWRSLTSGTPILMYHAFAERGEQAGRFIISSRRFALQTWVIKLAGFQVLGLDEYVRLRRANRLPPPRSVIITLDDGYEDSRKLAHAILRRRNIPATLFLVSKAMGEANGWDAPSGELSGRRIMSWAGAKRMLSGGIEAGAHTSTHSWLTELPSNRARDEIISSREDIEHHLGVEVSLFAYPYGDFDLATEQLVESAGFAAACGTRPGLNTPRTPLYALRRVEIRGTTSLLRFLLALWMGDTEIALSREAGD